MTEIKEKEILVSAWLLSAQWAVQIPHVPRELGPWPVAGGQGGGTGAGRDPLAVLWRSQKRGGLHTWSL